MSIFLTAHKEVMANEGGYANNPADRGGETYKGIARNFWLRWGGWKYVDGVTAQLVKMPNYGTSAYFAWVKHLNSKLAEISALQQLVLVFYEATFWKRLGEINDQTIATWIYDKDVNTGSMGSKWLQEALGVTVDGAIGPKTIAAANQADSATLLEGMKDHAAAYYLALAQKPHQKDFWHSWISRVGLSPEKLAQANLEARNLGIIA
jgi:lysozyme family protein